MPNTDSHGRPIIVAANWFGKLPAQARRLKPGEQPPNEDAALASDGPAADRLVHRHP